MKWIFVNAIKHQDWGGMENWMLKLCTTLPAMGEPCLMLARSTSRWPATCRESNIPFQPCPFGGDFSPWVTARIRAICHEFKPDIAVVKGFRQARFVRQAWPAAAVAVKLPAANELTPAWTDRLTYQHCIDRILVDNHSARSVFLQHPWVLPGKIAAVHNGVAIPDLSSLPPERKRLREFLHIPETSLVIGASGRLVSGKAFDDAIRALAGLNCTAQPHLVIFGNGPEQSALLTLAAELGLGSRVHLAGWQNDAKRLLWGCDAFLHPSLAEGLPNTVLESMAGGVPVVATSAGGTTEIFTGELADLVVAPHDTQGMAARLSRMMSDPDLRLRLGRHARNHVEQNFSIPSMAAAIRQVLQSAALARKSAMAPPVRGPEAGVHWLTTPAGGVAPEALSWSDPADAREVSRSDKAAVHRVHIGGLEYYIKRFTGDWLGLRRLGLRQPAAATNFRIAHKIFLRGATTVPHLAAGWRRNGNAPGTSLLITGTLKGFVTADQWLQGAPLSLQSRRIFTRDIAHWLAHLHGAGISCHDLKYSNILVGRQEGRFAFALLDLDNCRVRFVNASAHDVQRNLHQLFRSFQKNLEPADVLCFLAEYRKAAGLSRQRARRIFAVVEKRLCRRGTGYRELRRRKTAVL